MTYMTIRHFEPEEGWYHCTAGACTAPAVFKIIAPGETEIHWSGTAACDDQTHVRAETDFALGGPRPRPVDRPALSPEPERPEFDDLYHAEAAAYDAEYDDLDVSEYDAWHDQFDDDPNPYNGTYSEE